MLRLQGHLFLNPDHLPAVPWTVALNTTASFVTNTNWQYYAGEATMSYLSQMAGLAVQQFISAGAGLAVLAAVARGIAKRGSGVGLGNFWRDLYRSIVYILLPLAIILAVVLISQGVPQTFHGHVTATTLQGAHQTIARGPVGSMISIKQLGTNGGGFYDSNSAVPFENPTPLSNFLEVLAILLIPFAQLVMFGRMVFARRHAWVLYSVCFAIFAIGVSVAFPSEQHGSAVLRSSGVNITHSASQVGGNMTDKEVRFGIANTALWATATTDVSNGSVNGGHDAFTPAGGAVPLVNMFLGEVEPGGVGSGVYGLIFYVLIAVFVAGLMVGRTPEWLGKKIEAREMKLAAVGALAVPTMALVMTAVAISTKSGLASIFNPGAHGFSETLYAYTSQSNNNGSAFAGYGGDGLLDDVRNRRALLRPLLPAARRARDRRLARREEGRPCIGRDVPDRRRHVRRHAARSHRAHGGSDDPAGPDARPDRGRADALMLRALFASVVAIVVSTVVLGFAYPALMTGVAQLTMSHQANGSLVSRGGKVVGSSLAAQSFSFPGYFHERPSATSPAYNPGFTTFSNLGPTNPALAQLVQQNAKAILKLEGPYNPGLTIHQIPVDAVVPSGSGIDPEISIAYANLQARRVAAVRHLPLATVQQLISKHTQQRTFAFLGEPGVNVLELNLAIDQQVSS